MPVCLKPFMAVAEVAALMYAKQSTQLMYCHNFSWMVPQPSINFLFIVHVLSDTTKVTSRG